MKTEQWKKHNDKYAVSSWGRFYNLETKKFIKGHLHQSNGGTYRRVKFGELRVMAHVLVAYYFKIPPKFFVLGGYHSWVVNHLDGNTLNNNENNVEFSTQSRNVSHWHLLKKGPSFEIGLY